MNGENGKLSPHREGTEPAKAAGFWPDSIPLPAANILVVGLGPGPLHALTLAAWQALNGAAQLVFRTLRHPCIAVLPAGLNYTSFDDLYEKHTEFAAVYAEIAQRVVEMGRAPGGVVYAVPGHPWVGEATTPLIHQAAAAAGLEVAVLDGVSFVEPCFGAVGVDLMDGSQVFDAMLLAQQHHPRLDPGLPLLVGQVYSRSVASDLKLTLLNAYADEHPVQTIRAAGGNPAGTAHEIPLYALDHEDAFDHLTSVYVPPVAAGASLSHLQEIVAHLRAPEGCPWDQAQTLDSLKQDLLSECMEVLEAIDLENSADASRGEVAAGYFSHEDSAGAGDEDGDELSEDAFAEPWAGDSELLDNSEHIAEELGDLLMVIFMLIQIATEEGRFRMGDVTQGIVEKLIRRHPHVFGETVVDSVGQVVSNWDAIKVAEKAARGKPAPGPLDGIPSQLPALEKARQLQAKAEKADLLARAELAAGARALAAELADSPQRFGTQAWGELLWRLVALAHTHEINLEDALRTYAVTYRAQAQQDSPPAGG